MDPNHTEITSEEVEVEDGGAGVDFADCVDINCDGEDVDENDEGDQQAHRGASTCSSDAGDEFFLSMTKNTSKMMTTTNVTTSGKKVVNRSGQRTRSVQHTKVAQTNTSTSWNGGLTIPYNNQDCVPLGSSESGETPPPPGAIFSIEPHISPREVEGESEQDTNLASTAAEAFFDCASEVATAGTSVLEGAMTVASAGAFGQIVTQRRVEQARRENKELHAASHQKLDWIRHQLTQTNRGLFVGLTHLNSQIEQVRQQITDEFNLFKVEAFGSSCRKLQDYVMSCDPHSYNTDKILDYAIDVDVSADVVLSNATKWQQSALIQEPEALMIAVLEAKAFALGCKHQTMTSPNKQQIMRNGLADLRSKIQTQIQAIMTTQTPSVVELATGPTHEILQRCYHLHQWILACQQQQQHLSILNQDTDSAEMGAIMVDHDIPINYSGYFDDGMGWVREMKQSLLARGDTAEKEQYLNQEIRQSVHAAATATEKLNKSFSFTKQEVQIKFVSSLGNQFVVTAYSNTDLGAFVIDRLHLSKKKLSKAFRYALQESCRAAESENEIAQHLTEAFQDLRTQQHAQLDQQDESFDGLLECIAQQRWQDLSTCLGCHADDDKDIIAKERKYFSLHALKRMADTLLMTSKVLQRYQAYGQFKTLRLLVFAAKSEEELLNLLKSRAANPRLLGASVVKNILASVEEKKYFKLLRTDHFDCDWITDPPESDDSASSGWCAIS